MNTYFSTKTAPQYTCDLFMKSKEDYQKFDAIFSTRLSYSKSIEKEVREWVAENVEEWVAAAPAWFKIELVPDNFLPRKVFVALGGLDRRRMGVANSSVYSISKRDRSRRSTDRSKGRVGGAS